MGFFAYTGLVYWVFIAMNKYGGIDILSSAVCTLLLSLYLALYTGLFSFMISFLESRSYVPFFIISPTFWTFLEYLRTYLLSGFPWGLLAYSQHSFIPMIQICSLLGPYYISFLIVSVNTSIFTLLKKERRSKMVYLFSFFTAFLFFTTLFYGLLSLNRDSDKGKKISVAIIQASIPQDVKWTEEYKIKTILKYFEKTNQIKGKVDLILWPETALPFVLEENPEILKGISRLAKERKISILAGALSRDENKRLYNAAFLFDQDGEIKGIYRKVHLVPFGEYTPLVKYFPFLSRISVSGEDFTPGRTHKPLDLQDFGKLGILICYEGIFPGISRETVNNGANVLINLTNDAWYDKSSAPFQHFAFYIFRAVETGMYVLRCANTGISAIVDPRGRIVEKSSLFTEETLYGEVFLKNEQTFYVKHGDWFILVLVFIIVALFSWNLLSHKNLRKK